MFIVRPAIKEDFDAIYQMSKFTQSGLTTLPHDKEILQNRIMESHRSFDSDINKPKGETYLFVIENDSRVVGICSIVSKVGGFEPLYTYEIKTSLKKSRLLNVQNEIKFLQLLRVHNGPSELGTLFLLPEARKKGTGRLLSLSRLLFIAQYPSRFEDRIIAEMRGYFDENGKSPFWEAVSRYFFPTEFEVVDLMQMKDKSFIEDLIPEHPLYISLLPYAAQKVIGKVHKDTEPALRLLKEAGFECTNEISIFDAGPVVSAQTNTLGIVKDSQKALIAGFVDDIDSDDLYLIANIKSISHFRATIGKIIRIDGRTVQLTNEVGESLQLMVNDPVRYFLLNAE